MTQRTKLLSLIGSKCYICGSNKSLRFHEVHGKTHECRFLYVLNHKTDFITLCQKHHVMLHFYKRVEKLGLIQKRKLIRFASIIQ